MRLRPRRGDHHVSGPGRDDHRRAAPAGDDHLDGGAAAEGTFPVTLNDDNGNSVTIKAKPMRIVSTAPASTEILFALGVGDRVVGVTSLDDYPPEAANIAKIGDFQPNTEAIMALSPDLVVGYSGNEEALAPVQAAGAPVLIFNPADRGRDLRQHHHRRARRPAPPARRPSWWIDQGPDQAGRRRRRRPPAARPRSSMPWTTPCGPPGPARSSTSCSSWRNATNVGSMPGADSAAAQAYYQFAPEQLVAADPT